MKWLITGGCGFLGTSLVRALAEEDGHLIRVLDNLSVGTRRDLANVCKFVEIDRQGLKTSAPSHGGAKESKVELIVADILDEALALDVAKGMDVIAHLAANTGVAPSVENPRIDCLTNVVGTLNYLEAARHGKVKRFIFASSGAPIGECEPPIHEKIVPQPVSPYGASKLAGEGYCSAYFRTFGVETVALRFGNVYGPGSTHKTSVVAKFIRHALGGKPLEIFGDGRQTRDFVYVEDLVGAIRLAAKQAGIGGEVFQIATSVETTVSEMCERLVAILKEDGVGDIATIHSNARIGDIKRNYSDTRKARERLGWVCNTSLDDGLRKTIAWFVASENPTTLRRRKELGGEP
jgi:UDP-glucose 4-epimerase